MCGDCKELSIHLWANVGVTDVQGAYEPLDLLKKTKRITLCTACGTIKATT